MKNIILLSLLTLSAFSDSFAQNDATQNDSTEKVNKSSKPVTNIVTVNNTKRRVSIKSLAIGATKAMSAINKSPFSDEGVWDSNTLNNEQELSELLHKFIQNQYALKAKTLNLQNKTKDDLVNILLTEGFEKKNPDGVMKILSKSKDRELQDPGEIYQHPDGSVVKIRDYSDKRKFRPQAYVLKYAVRNPEGPPTWQNEIFKISIEGNPIPKAPKSEYGMKMKAPESSGPEEDQGWMNLIMEEAYIDLKPK